MIYADSYIFLHGFLRLSAPFLRVLRLLWYVVSATFCVRCRNCPENLGVHFEKNVFLGGGVPLFWKRKRAELFGSALVSHRKISVFRSDFFIGLFCAHIAVFCDHFRVVVCV